jgi:hypothetical protein
MPAGKKPAGFFWGPAALASWHTKQFAINFHENSFELYIFKTICLLIRHTKITSCTIHALSMPLLCFIHALSSPLRQIEMTGIYSQISEKVSRMILQNLNL